MTNTHTAACFIRVDVIVADEASRDAYKALSERLQDLLQEVVLAPAKDGEAIDLQGMTCLVLGPIPEAETIDMGEDFPDFFAPVGEWLEAQTKDRLPP